MACTVHVLFLVSGFCIDNNAVMQILYWELTAKNEIDALEIR